jgi:hypothetical protein
MHARARACVCVCVCVCVYVTECLWCIGVVVAGVVNDGCMHEWIT